MVSSCVYYIVFPVLLSIFPTKIPGSAGDFLRSVFFLPLHVDQGLEHFVGDGDNLRVALETALGDDHGGELVGVFHGRSCIQWFFMLQYYRKGVCHKMSRRSISAPERG